MDKFKYILVIICEIGIYIFMTFNHKTIVVHDNFSDFEVDLYLSLMWLFSSRDQRGTHYSNL